MESEYKRDFVMYRAIFGMFSFVVLCMLTPEESGNVPYVTVRCLGSFCENN